MKKVCVILLLVGMVLLPGCESTDNGQNSPQAKPTAADPGRSSLWDQNAGLMTAGPARPQPQTSRTRTPARPTSTAAQPQAARVARTNIEPVKQSNPIPPDLMMTPVGELEPVTTESSGPLFESDTPVRPGLVAVGETGAHGLSIVYPRPDYGIIQVNKTMPEEVRLNTPFTYTVTVTNLTETMLTQITITESLSKEFQFKASEPTGSVEGNKLTWEIDSLGPKASKSLRISGIATGAKQLEHSTAITHTIRDTAVVRVVEPSLELKKIAPNEALLCEPISVEFIVTNTGTGAAQNVQVVDNLPAGLQTVDGKGRITLDGGTLAAGESRRFSVKLRATKTGAYVGKAIATSASGTQAESEATTINIRQPILSITKSGPRRQYLSRPVAYEIAVLNKGDGPAQNTTIEDIIPPGVTGVEATAGAQFSGSKLVWELGTLEPNASKKVRVSYTPLKEGEVMATATASAYCAEPVSDSSRTAVAGIGALHLEVDDSEDPVEIGSTTTYLITVTNEGSAADNNIRIVCTLDDKLQYVSSAGVTAGSIMGKTVSFAPLHTLEPQGKATWRAVVRGVKAGDIRFKVAMHSDELVLPVEETEATHVYQQFGSED